MKKDLRFLLWVSNQVETILKCLSLWTYIVNPTTKQPINPVQRRLINLPPILQVIGRKKLPRRILTSSLNVLDLTKYKHLLRHGKNPSGAWKSTCWILEIGINIEKTVKTTPGECISGGREREKKEITFTEERNQRPNSLFVSLRRSVLCACLYVCSSVCVCVSMQSIVSFAQSQKGWGLAL